MLVTLSRVKQTAQSICGKPEVGIPCNLEFWMPNMHTCACNSVGQKLQSLVHIQDTVAASNNHGFKAADRTFVVVLFNDPQHGDLTHIRAYRMC